MLRVYHADGTILAQKQTAVTITQIPEDAYNRALYAFYEPYTIFCSERFLQEILSPGSMEERISCRKRSEQNMVYGS